VSGRAWVYQSFLDPSWVYDVIPEVEEMDERYGCSNIGQGEKVQIEFVSANPTGLLHMGNARGAALGDSLANRGNKKRGIVALCVVIAAVIVIGTLVSCGGNGGGKEEAIDSIALLDAGYSYDLENAQFVIHMVQATQ